MSLIVYTYEELLRRANSAISEFSHVRDKDSWCWDRELGEEVRAIASYLDRRRLPSFKRRVRQGDGFRSLLLNLFVSSRLGCFHTEYIKIRECEPEDRVTGFDQVLNRWLLRAGRHPLLAPYIRRRSFPRFHISLPCDPIVTLRRMYLLHLRPEKYFLPTWRFNGLRLLFHIQASVIWRVAVIFFDRFRADPASALTHKSGQPNNFALCLVQQICTLFGVSGKEVDQARLVSEGARIIGNQLQSLDLAMTERSKNNFGYFKFIKLVLGVLFERAKAPWNRTLDPTDYILNSLDLACAWGVTYPLVDDALDHADQSSSKDEVIRVVLSFTDGTAIDHNNLQCDVAAVLARSLARVFEIVPAERRLLAGSLVRSLMLSHVDDARRRLSDHRAGRADDLAPETVLKAALIRITTKVICGNLVHPPTGSQVDEEKLSDHVVIDDSILITGLHNQVGDDFCDIAEDYHDGCATNFTLYLIHGGNHPIKLFIDLALYLTRGQSRPRRRAAIYGVFETFRILLDSPDSPDSQGLPVQQMCADFFRICPAASPLADHCWDLPFLELDTLLCQLERSLRASGQGYRRRGADVPNADKMFWEQSTREIGSHR